MPNAATNTDNIHGNKLYQERARIILPILVRQAIAMQNIIYSNLAEEVKMPNSRNLDYPLGSIGVTLNELAEKWGESIPPIQSLVINKNTGLPGSGFDEFLNNRGRDYKSLGRREKLIYLESYWADIYAYSSWDKVLDELGLEQNKSTDAILLGDGAVKSGCRGGGEGPEHKALKEYVKNNPHIVGLPLKHPTGKIEYDLPSGDAVDVVFEYRKNLIAVEVKSRISGVSDIRRGLYQCVKYDAVLRARQGFNQTEYDIQTLLVLENEFPTDLIPLRNCLGVKVIKNITVK